MTLIPAYIDGTKARLNTTANEDGLPLGDFVELRNVDLSSGYIGRRGGMQRLFRVAEARTCFNLNGTSEIITVPANAAIHTLRKEWTVRVLVNPDTVAAARTPLGWAHATDWPIQIQFSATAKVVVKVTDSAGTVVTMTGTTTLVGGTTYVVDVVRIGTALTVYLNGVSEQTGTMADLDCKAPGGSLTFGAANGADFFDGKWDNSTAWSAAITDRSEGFMRCTDPSAAHVLWDYVGTVNQATTLRVDDGSRFENHGTATSGISTATTLGVQVMPVTMMAPYTDSASKARLAVITGTQIRLAEIGK